jgi:hypothetical protein
MTTNLEACVAIIAGLALGVGMIAGPRLREAAAQGLPISTDGTDPKTWPPQLEATIAAPENHKIIYEDQNIRVLSVTIAPGATEIRHYHRWPSVLVFDTPPKVLSFDANGKEMPPRTRPEKVELPMVLRLPPEAAHSNKNLDPSNPIHLIRLNSRMVFQNREWLVGRIRKA